MPDTPTNGVSRNGHPATLNDTFRRGQSIPLSVKPAVAAPKEAQPVSVSYTNRTTTQIVNEQFQQADEHTDKISRHKETAYMIIETMKFALVVAMSWGGGTFAANWTPAPGAEVLMGIKFASVIVFAIGPWLAYALSYYLKIGVFMGPSKLIAWTIITCIIFEEALALRAIRDPEFAHFLMVDFAPYSLAGILVGIVSLTYLRSDLKRKRDLAEMKAAEEEIIAKNATDARMMKAKEESRARTVRKAGQFIGHATELIFAGILFIPMAIVRRSIGVWGRVWDSVKPPEDPAKKPEKKTTTRKPSSKKAGQGRRK